MFAFLGPSHHPNKPRFLAFTTGTDRAPLGGLKDVRLVAPEPQPGKMTGGTKRPSRDKWDWKG